MRRLGRPGRRAGGGDGRAGGPFRPARIEPFERQAYLPSGSSVPDGNLLAHWHPGRIHTGGADPAGAILE